MYIMRSVNMCQYIFETHNLYIYIYGSKCTVYIYGCSKKITHEIAGDQAVVTILTTFPRGCLTQMMRTAGAGCQPQAGRKMLVQGLRLLRCL